MKTLWSQIVCFENLYTAWRKAKKGGAKSAEVAGFELDLEPQLFRLQSELIEQRWRPGPYRHFTIYDRKPRKIQAAPFADRVVQHALMNIAEPTFDRALTQQCYACRKNLGVHKAVYQYQQWSRHYPYALKLDISRYFASIDHQMLQLMLAEHFSEEAVLALFSVIIQSTSTPTAEAFFPGDDLVGLMQRPTGLPIGNLCSQHLANIYLASFDRFILNELNCQAYLRYVDDMVLLAKDKQTLWLYHQAIKQKLLELRLVLHPKKQQLVRTKDGLDMLGYRVFPNNIRLRRDNGYRFRRKLRGMPTPIQQRRLSSSAIR